MVLSEVVLGAAERFFVREERNFIFHLESTLPILHVKTASKVTAGLAVLNQETSGHV